jgi:tRNA threonylcarbamoyladenosine biosynthesis protein TsaB
MLIITIRTDKPDAELGLYDGQQQLKYETWPAHRELSTTIHQKLDELLASQDKKIEDVQGVLCFKGPGSFTGLRIGLTVGNTLAYGLGVPIVSTTGDTWQQDGIQKLLNGENEEVSLPEYGRDARITQQKK